MGSTVNISFEDDFLARIDRQAKAESRNRSELLREAARMYLDRRETWDQLFAMGSKAAKVHKITEPDITAEIQAVRRQKRH